MYRKLPRSSDQVLGYAIEGRITQDEVEQMQAEIGEAMERHGSTRLLARIEGMEDVEPSAVWQDMKMVPEYTRHVQRAAVVGDRRWQEWATRLADVFAEARYFETGDEEQAWAWLRENGKPA
ncbi:MAG TPA: STAS/SEC14 domain-containing protein [Egibacteraceae bacterium]|nr:STAS/SEC14 domain-containing protein [Egibacteraceae bacterium]